MPRDKKLLEFETSPIVFVKNPIHRFAGDKVYCALHSHEPLNKQQTSFEVVYQDYTRVEIGLVDGFASGQIMFTQAAGGSCDVTWFSIGAEPRGNGDIFVAFPISPNFSISLGVTAVVNFLESIKVK